MLKRNIKVKLAPGTFQDTPKQFDFIISFEERVFDIITEVFSERPPLYDKPVCLIGLNVVDNHESAILGAMDVYNLLQLVVTTSLYPFSLSSYVFSTSSSSFSFRRFLVTFIYFFCFVLH
eukprot:TRINITY_DN4968_c0_g1_i8.p1 TRINITY_DN4968_c0_g1~~TRINITY_DN4968_c0_g1_i8.p1  ORF type:complete len:120 (-),score=20.65 TRINITY_DN4968_c0_g1_i8:324-683(-)